MKATQNKSKQASRRSIRRLAKRIADNLLTVNCGMKTAEMGDRLAIKKSNKTPKDPWKEEDLGGRCRGAVESVIRDHLLKWSNLE